MAGHTGPLSCWSYLRAALITLALLAQCVNAFPDKPLTEEKLARPQGRRSVRWLSRLSGASDVATSAQLVAWSERGVTARKWLLAPLAPVLQGAALRQQWNLFLTVSDEVFRLRIDVQALDDKTWRLVYRANELDALGLSSLLSYRRVRGIYNPSKYGARSQYESLTGWLAQRVLQEHPTLSALRVSMERLSIGEPRVAARLLDTRYPLEHTRGTAP